MPYLPPHVRRDLVGAVPVQQWMAWADGQPVGPPPHTLHQEFGCEINRDFTDSRDKNDIIRYKKGMQGHLLEEKTLGNGLRVAKIFIQGVTEGTGYSNRWIPRANIDKGMPWKPDFEDWDIKIHVKLPSVNTPSLTQLAPDSTVLGITITKLIEAIYKTPADFLGTTFKAFVDKWKGPTPITKIILQAIRKAGILGVLNKPNFTVQDLLDAATLTIDGTGPPSADVIRAGVYTRFHLSSPTVQGHWKPNTRYGYVGKSVNLDARYTDHKNANKPTNYAHLNRGSVSLDMIALAILDSTDETYWFFLIEQIFVLLFQTYKDVLRTPGTMDNLWLINHYEDAQYFLSISETVFSVTGWRGALQRPSFGIREGANLGSPLAERENVTDKTLFIRMDTDIKDEVTRRQIPMSYFRRATAVNIDHKEQIVFCIEGQKRTRVVFKLPSRWAQVDASQAPPIGTACQLIIEVRRDGTPHPHAWSRLCDIGRWKNWDQARSFAVRLEWQHPAHSSSWRIRYIHASEFSPAGLYKTFPDAGGEPGALKVYGKAIAFLTWLYNGDRTHCQAWIPNIGGHAHVLQAEYDLMHQCIHIKRPSGSLQFLPGKPKSGNEIKTEMNNPKYRLSNVGATSGVSGNRKNCDACVLKPDKVPGGETCKPIGNGTLCEHCQYLGRPCCSWTPGVFHQKSAPEHTAEENAKNVFLQSVLAYKAVTEVPERLQNFDNRLRVLQVTDVAEEELEDDVFRAEEGDGDTESDEDEED